MQSIASAPDRLAELINLRGIAQLGPELHEIERQRQHHQKPGEEEQVRLPVHIREPRLPQQPRVKPAGTAVHEEQKQRNEDQHEADQVPRPLVAAAELLLVDGGVIPVGENLLLARKKLPVSGLAGEKHIVDRLGSHPGGLAHERFEHPVELRSQQLVKLPRNPPGPVPESLILGGDLFDPPRIAAVLRQALHAVKLGTDRFGPGGQLGAPVAVHPDDPVTLAENQVQVVDLLAAQRGLEHILRRRNRKQETQFVRLQRDAVVKFPVLTLDIPERSLITVEHLFGPVICESSRERMKFQSSIRSSENESPPG